MENIISNQTAQNSADLLGPYGVKGYLTISWQELIGLEEPKDPTPDSEPFSGVSSFLSKINIYFSTRNYFLQYLQFYSSYDKTYEQLYFSYAEILKKTKKKIDEVYKLSDMKEIEARYLDMIQYGITEIKDNINAKYLHPIYLTFFKNVQYFKEFANGYSFCFDEEYYANTIGNKYTLLGEVNEWNCVEFDKDENVTNNFRLYPFIPLDVNPNKPILKLAIFGNNLWISPVEFILPYSNPNKPNYLYSVNSIEISKSIEELKSASLEFDVSMEYKYYYFNKKLYKASDNPITKKIKLYWVNNPEPMVGVSLFVAGDEWIDKK